MFKIKILFLLNLLFISFNVSQAQENSAPKRLLLSQFAVFKVEEFPYFSNDVMTLLISLSVSDCTLNKKSMFKRWFPTLSKIDNSPKNEKDVLKLIRSLDMGELLFLGKVIRYENEQSLNFKMLQDQEKKFNDCFTKNKNKLENTVGQNRATYEKDLAKYSKTLLSFHNFIIEHYEKVVQNSDKKDLGRSVLAIFDSIAKKYSHDVYKF